LRQIKGASELKKIDLGPSFEFHAAAAAVLSAVFCLGLFLIAGKEKKT
jgi:hypothetical protein